jgi:5'(3')-deoxyribonucleotidase
MKILLDMDGVLVDFLGGWCKYNEYECPTYNDAKDRWDLAGVLGITPAGLWAGCSSREFWAELEWTQDGMGILNAAEDAVGQDNVYLFTTPTPSPQSWAGKADWILRQLPQYKNRLLMGGNKQLCARPDQLLIDDADHNVEKFRAAGGPAILVPRQWNSLHWLHVSPTEYVKVGINLSLETQNV